MPTKIALQGARRDARQGKKPTTQAAEFVKEEMHRYEQGSGSVRSRKQAIAIGLSEARRAGVKLEAPKGGSTGTRRKAARDSAIASGAARPSASRSAGARKAARTRAKKYAR